MVKFFRNLRYLDPISWLKHYVLIVFTFLAVREEIPVHQFVTKEIIGKSGKKKGGVKFVVNLIVNPYVYKRKKDARTEGKEAFFSCIKCEEFNVSSLNILSTKRRRK